MNFFIFWPSAISFTKKIELEQKIYALLIVENCFFFKKIIYPWTLLSFYIVVPFHLIVDVSEWDISILLLKNKVKNWIGF